MNCSLIPLLKTMFNKPIRSIYISLTPKLNQFAFCVFVWAFTHIFSVWCEWTPWRQPEVAARKLGINSSFIKGDYCYVLVRVSRFRETARFAKPIPANQMLYDDVSALIETVTPGNSSETIQFMTNFGTHYINSFVTGNALYQVCIRLCVCVCYLLYCDHI